MMEDAIIETPAAVIPRMLTKHPFVEASLLILTLGLVLFPFVPVKAAPSNETSLSALNSVYMLSSNDGWAVGDPIIWHYDGSIWNPIATPKFPDFPFQPSDYNLTSVSFGPPGEPVSSSDGWAVGYNGTVAGAACGDINGTCSVAIHWDGIGWRPQTAGLSTVNAGPLWSVSMVSSTDVWAVGQNSVGQGVFWHWSGMPGLGGGWNLVQPPVPGQVYSIFMVSSSEGWAVGSGGAIYHYVGGSWISFTSPVTNSLRAVFMIDGTEGWAVGDGGTVIDYAGGVWSGQVSPGTSSQNLVSVFMVSSMEGWAFGLAGTILHYWGGSWTVLPQNLVPTSPVSVLAFHSAYFNSVGDGWIVGDAELILHYDGTLFGSATVPSLNNFTSVSFGPPLSPVNPNDGWVVGNASAIAPFEPTIYHWNGFIWTKGVSVGTTDNLYSVFKLNDGDVWAVGGGTHTTTSCSASLCPIILHFTGASWNSVELPPGSDSLKSVFMVSSTEGWAVGEQASSPHPTGIILHYTVTGGVGAWGIFPAPSTPSLPGLNSVFMLDQNEGWSVGDNATILHYTVSGGVGSWNLLTVSAIPPGLSQDANLTSIFMLNPLSGWAVGGIQAAGSFSAGPVIIDWDGTNWEQVAAPSLLGGITPTGLTSGTLTSVFFTGPTNGWAVGFPGKISANILHWDGISWKLVTLTPPPDVFTAGVIPPILTSIYMTSPWNGWVVGGGGLVGGSSSNVAGRFRTLSAAVQLLPSNLANALVSAATSATAVTTVTTLTTVTATTTPITSTPSFANTTSMGTVTPAPPTGGAVPGFPIESIIVGIIVGVIALAIVRRRQAKGTNCSVA